MAKITDEGLHWKLEIFPEADALEEINETAKGYRALLGYDPQTERHVIMHVMYDKNKYEIGDVLKKIDEMKACPRCDTLDKVRLSNLSIETNSNSASVPTLPIRSRTRTPPEIPPQYIDQPPVAPAPTRSRDIKNMFTDAMFDAYLTSAGKLLMGNVFGDESMTEEAFPKSQEEMAQLWDDSTSGRFLRSPDEAKEFMSILKENSQSPGTPGSSQSKTAKKVTKGFVVY